jgi:cytochrome c oxidase cbb3-type subunit I/II
LVYGNFLETVSQIVPMYWMRAIGGTLYLVGALIMGYNLYKTIRKGKRVEDEEATAMPLQKVSSKRVAGEKYHPWLERRPIRLTILATLVVLIGGIVQIVPTLMVKSNIPTISSVNPYTPLELEGRDIYIREGCVSCHSQMVRPFRSEVVRYGPYSRAGEFVYDHPFLWGSKRTGPDLLRLGGKYADSWHLNHMYDPQSTSPGSIMPAYPWLLFNELDTKRTLKKMEVMVDLGVPYSEDDISNGLSALDKQAQEIAVRLLEDPQFADAYNNEERNDAFVPLKDREIVALIAYMQRLGTDLSNALEPEQTKE